MNYRVGIAFALLVSAVGLPPPAAAAVPSIASSTQGMTRQEGYFPLSGTRQKDACWWRSPASAKTSSTCLPSRRVWETWTSASSSTVELPGDEYIARFERVGPKVHLVLQNRAFARSPTTPRSRGPSRSPFPPRPSASLEVVAEEAGKVLVDVTPFFLSDVMDVRGVVPGDAAGHLRPRPGEEPHPPAPHARLPGKYGGRGAL